MKNAPHIDCEDPQLSGEREAIRQRMSRRLFMALTAKGMVAASLVTALGITGAPPVYADTDNRVVPLRPFFTPDERLLLAAVQDHLLPSEPDSPGARDIHATQYLEAALFGRDVDPSDSIRIREGCAALRGRVKERGNKEFVALSERERERVLRDFEDTHEGDLWLTLVLGYTLEAYVGDPSYGGNPDEVVWRWLGHRPGFPRPPKQTEATRR